MPASRDVSISSVARGATAPPSRGRPSYPKQHQYADGRRSRTAHLLHLEKALLLPRTLDHVLILQHLAGFHDAHIVGANLGRRSGDRYRDRRGRQSARGRPTSSRRRVGVVKVLGVFARDDLRQALHQRMVEVLRRLDRLIGFGQLDRPLGQAAVRSAMPFQSLVSPAQGGGPPTVQAETQAGQNRGGQTGEPPV